MTIQEIMSTPAITCRPTDTLDAAARIMWDRDCGVVPVVDDDGAITGMLTDRDICMAAYMQGAPLHTIRVASAMAKEVYSCHAHESLEAAERTMRDHQVRRVPIVNGSRHPIGLLSLNDIARHAASSRKRNGLDREVTLTLAAICEQRQLPEKELRAGGPAGAQQPSPM